MKQGKVWLLGAGPGDAGLLTIKAHAVLKQADVVVYDALVGPGVLAMIPAQARCIFVGKRAGNHPVPQHEINQILLREALAGHHVARLKGGDPFVFGRGGEELELLCEHNIPYEIVPGIPSAVAVPAYAGIPVTHRDCASSVHIITGHTKASSEAEIDYEALVRLGGTLVFLMGLSALPAICDGLLRAGMRPDMPAAVLERGTTAHQRAVVCTVKDLPQRVQSAGIQPPSVCMVGEVCALHHRFAWAQDRPLGGACIVVTRPQRRSSGLAERLCALGAQVLELPAIRTQLLAENAALQYALNHLAQYGWLALTSPSGAEHFFEVLRAEHMDIRALAGIKLAVVGAATRQVLEEKGLFCEVMPEQFCGEQLGQALARQAKGSRVLLLRAKEASGALTQALTAASISYDDIALYETVYHDTILPELCDAIRDHANYAAFASASAVKGFALAMGTALDVTALHAVCIGKQTAAEAEKHGMKTSVAPVATMDAMAELLVELEADRNRQKK